MYIQLSYFPFVDKRKRGDMGDLEKDERRIIDFFYPSFISLVEYI